jgi:hypothetical protein
VNLIASRENQKIVINQREELPFFLSRITIGDRHYAPVSLLTDWWYEKPPIPLYAQVPATELKFIYTMFESGRLPPRWVKRMNEVFDAAILPHRELVKVYRSSGVTIPLFVVPLPILIEEMLHSPLKTRQTFLQKKGPFIFSTIAGNSPTKNYNLLLDAFAQEFGNRKNVRLAIHSSWGDRASLRNKIASLGIKNVTLSTAPLNREHYRRFLANADCYILISRGEGYSITPREALALGIPCIVSRIRVHQDLCTLPSVLGVELSLLEDSLVPTQDPRYRALYNHDLMATRAALRRMYNNYQHYLARAPEGRDWVRKYTSNSLAPFFQTLVQPYRIILGNANIIKRSTLITKSRALYEKYRKLLKKRKTRTI